MPNGATMEPLPGPCANTIQFPHCNLTKAVSINFIGWRGISIVIAKGPFDDSRHW